jgi:hypothetical protein
VAVKGPIPKCADAGFDSKIEKDANMAIDKRKSTLYITILKRYLL